MNMIEEALPAFGSESDEGDACIKALGILRKIAGKRDSSDLVPAEVMQMVRQLPQMGGGTDVQRMILQQMQRGGAGGSPQMPPGGQPQMQPQQMPQAAM